MPDGKPDDRLKVALERFKFAADAEEQQRQREQIALDFDGGDQWPDWVKIQREGQQDGSGARVGARPMLTMSLLDQPIESVVNQLRSARLSIEFAAKGDGANRETAEVYSDLARTVQVESRANLARLSAFDRAVRVGRGAYRILTEYANDGDFNLDIVYKRILNQASVYFDPFAQEPDWSDGQFCFITEDIAWPVYKRQFPKSKLIGPDGELTSVGDEQPSWITDTEDGGKAVRIAEYFYVEVKKRDKAVMADGTSGYLDELGEVDPALVTKRRTVEERSVKWCKINAAEILEEQDWPGRYIPVIPVTGKEKLVKQQRRFVGMIEPAMDAQRSYNFMRTAQVEQIGLSNKSPFIVAWEQIADFKGYWETANVKNWAYLPYKGMSAQGHLLPPPQRDVAEPPIQAITVAVQEARNDVHATTGVPPVALGQLDPHDRSGKAIQSLQRQAEESSSGYLDNLVSCSMVYEGKILRDLIPRVYDAPGRIVEVLGADDQRRSVMLNAPHVMQDGQPQPTPDGPQAKTYDLSKGAYTVAVKVTHGYGTKSEQSFASLTEVLQAQPQLFPIIGDIWAENSGAPWAHQVADRLRKVMNPELREDQQDAERQLQQAKQQMGQMSQVLEMQTQELQAKTRIIETDQVKAQQQMALEELRQRGENTRKAGELASEREIQKAKIAADLIKTQATLNAASAEAMLEAEMRRIDQVAAMAGEQADRVDGREMADQDRETALSEAERAREHEARLAESARIAQNGQA